MHTEETSMMLRKQRVSYRNPRVSPTAPNVLDHNLRIKYPTVHSNLEIIRRRRRPRNPLRKFNQMVPDTIQNRQRTQVRMWIYKTSVSLPNNTRKICVIRDSTNLFNLSIETHYRAPFVKIPVAILAWIKYMIINHMYPWSRIQRIRFNHFHYLPTTVQNPPKPLRRQVLRTTNVCCMYPIG